METLGKCPVCSAGSVVERTIGYQCDHFKSHDDKCTFTIFKSYFGKEITPPMVVTLLENGQTEYFNDLLTKEGKLFSAALIVKDGRIQPFFQTTALESACPKCAKRILVTTKGFACEDFFADKACDFYMSKSVAGVTLSEKEAEVLLNGGETDYKDDFTSRTGNEFGARIGLSADLQTEFHFSLTTCPKCKDGNISNNATAYGCSNYKLREGARCDFTIWRSIQGRIISSQQVMDICTKGQTAKLKFKTKSGEPFMAALVMDPLTFKVIVTKSENQVSHTSKDN